MYWVNSTTNPSSLPNKERISVRPSVGHHLNCSSRLLTQSFCCTSCRHGHMPSQLWRHLSFHLCLFWFWGLFCSVLRNHPWWGWGIDAMWCWDQTWIWQRDREQRLPLFFRRQKHFLSCFHQLSSYSDL